jgi:hypothetical protein
MNSPALTVFMYMGFIALLGLIGSQNRAIKVSSNQKCHESFEALGISLYEYKRVSDTEVFKVCGFRPALPVNTVWQENRPHKNSQESLEELTACKDDFAAAGHDPNDALTASDKKLFEVCGSIPLYFDD